jgi:hypothetical protein
MLRTAFVCLLWLVLMPGGLRAAPPPQEVVDVAAESLQGWLQAIPPDGLNHFSFNDEGEFRRTTLGEPFLTHYIQAPEIMAYADGAIDHVTIRPTTMWEFPVMCDGTPRTLLTVDLMDGVWTAVGIGGLSPAVEIAEMASWWPVSEGYELKYVRVFQSGSQFIQVTGNGLSDLVPIESTARSLGMIDQDESYDYPLMEVSDVIYTIAPFVRANVEGFNE